MRITEFLLARIAEDEAAQEPGYESAAWHRADCERNTYDAGPCDCGIPARVLAECEAKRRIVERHRWRPSPGMECDGHPGSFMPHGDYGPGFCMYAAERDGFYSEDIRDLAAVYADHPDYQQEWAL